MAATSHLSTRVIGCDIGNAYAYASIARGRAADPLPLMPAEITGAGMPTDVRISQSGEINVYPVDRSSKACKGGIVRTVKRMLRFDVLPQLKTDRPITPWEVYSAIARDLVRTANETSAKLGEPPTYNVAFTYPAHLHSPEHLDTLNHLEECIRSVELDGHRLNVVGRLPEPAAAAVQYLNFIQNVASESVRFHGNELNVLVYDLGHGTFDLALVTARNNITYDLWMQDGDETVGGVDFDDAVYDELCAQFYRTYHFRPSTATQENLLKEKARNAKIELCTPGVDSVDVSFDVYIDGEEQTLLATLTRERFEEISAPLLLKTMEKTAALLSRADREGVRVDRIILTGGASQMPIVRRSLQEMVGDRFTIEEPYQPSRAVSYGAALYGAEKNLKVKTEYHYGLMVRTSNEDIYYHLYTMIKPGETLPARSAPLVRHAPSSGLLSVQAAYSTDGITPAEKKRHLHLDALPKSGTLDIILEVGEDLNITLECRLPDGTVRRTSTRGNH